MGLLDFLFGNKNVSKTSVSNQPTQEFVHGWRGKEELFADFKKLIECEFSDYDVDYEVPAWELDPAAHPACTPIQFLFKKAGVPVLAVVIVRNNTYKGRNVLGTKEICEDRGITYIRFFEEYANTDEYVTDRIRSYLV